MITVLRLGHRRGRDDRISTHVGLTARQFGAENIVYAGEKDDNMLESLRDLSERWGGTFTVQYREDWRTVINEFSGVKIHLTMYGLPYQEHFDSVKTEAGGVDMLVIVGGEKVPKEVYGLADHNLAVGQQPHSEVAALAVFLHDLFGGDELDRDFPGAEIAVVPQEQGKKTQKSGDSAVED